MFEKIRFGKKRLRYKNGAETKQEESGKQK